MAVNISGATGFIGQRTLCKTSTGRLWQLVGTATTLKMWYSDDNGGTWTENTSAALSTSIIGNATASLFIDQDDHAHITYGGGASSPATSVNYRRMASISTSSAWGAATVIENTDLYWETQVVAHREGTGWVAHVVYSREITGGTNPDVIRYRKVDITSGGVVTAGTPSTRSANTAGRKRIVGLDFRHVAADATAVQASTPSLYLAWLDGTTLRFAKASYSSGTWSWGSTVDLAASGSVADLYYDLCYDGTRVLVAALVAVSGEVALWERDEADTTTTQRIAALASGSGKGQRVAYDLNDDVWTIHHDGSRLRHVKYDRSSNTWEALTTIVTENNPNASLSVRRGGQQLVDISFDATSSTRFHRLPINAAPTAATWVAPADNSGQDVGASLLLDWAFVDPDAGDSQSAYAMRRQIGAGSYAYWQASDSTWQAGEVKNVTATTQLTLAAGWGLDSDANHKYAVKTWDASDLAGVYSAELTVTPSVPSAPTITTPTDGGTHGSASLTAVWTCASQATYRVELLNSAGSSTLWDSGTLTSAAVRSLTIAYPLINGTAYKVRVTTTNAEGLTAAPDTNSFTATYTLPATPTLTATANNTTGVITIASTHPAPSGGQPTVTSAEVWVRCTAARTYPDMERPVGGVGIRVAEGLTPGVSWVDRACSSGVAYEYLVRAWADNGTFADSAWTA